MLLGRSRPSVNVIGAGIGGLVSAATLAKKGIKVRVFEKLKKAGGVLDTFKRGDYTFEATTHQLGGFGKDDFLKPTLDFLGINDLDIITIPNIYEALYVENGSISDRYILPSGETHFKNKLIEFFPHNQDEIGHFFSLIKNINSDIERLRKIMKRENLLPVLFDAVSAILVKFTKEGSSLQKLGMSSYNHLFSNINKTFHDLTHTFDKKLQSLLSQFWIYLGSPPSEASGILFLILIYLFGLKAPVMIQGGTRVLLDKLIGVIEDNGGEIYCNTAVASIQVEKGRAQGIVTEDGKSYPADYVISNISSYKTFSELVGEKNLPTGYFKSINNLTLSPSCFQVYAGVPFLLEDYGIKTETSFFNYSYDVDGNALKNPLRPSKDSPFVITYFSSSDKTFAPKGSSSFVVFEFDNHDRWKGLSRDEYSKLKQETQDLILGKIEALTGAPIRDKAEILFSSTPRTMMHYMSNRNAEMYGPATNIQQSLLKRTDPKTPIKNLFLAGAYTQASHGISSIIDSSFITAKTMI